MGDFETEDDVRSAHERLVSTQEREREVKNLVGLALRDVVLVLLAFASLVILVVDELNLVDPRYHDLIVALDLGIVVVFVAEFGWRMSKEVRKARFVARNWFDLLGMLPLALFEALRTIPELAFLRAFRLVRIARILAVASRAARAYNVIAGEKAAERLFARYRAALIEEVTDRVALKLIAQMEDSVVSARYPEAIGRALEERREDIQKAAREAIERLPLLRSIAMVPGSGAVVDRLAGEVADAAAATLKSDEANRIVAQSIREVLHNLKAEVARKEWKGAPGRT